jgi:hypothetical protein
MGSGASKPVDEVVKQEEDFGKQFCRCIAAAEADPENEGRLFELSYQVWRGMVEIGQRHVEILIQELDSWRRNIKATPTHWKCKGVEPRLAGSEIICRLIGGVEVSLFVPDPTPTGDAEAIRWHKESGNIARDATALRRAR